MSAKILELVLNYTSTEISFSGVNVSIPANSLYLYATLDDGSSNQTVYADMISFVNGIFESGFSSEEYVLNFTLEDTYSITSSFQPLVAGINFNFRIDSRFYAEFPYDNGDTSSGGFSVPDLDGNFGAYSNGSIVTVLGRKGDYTIEASQQLWSFPADSFQGSCVIYKLSQNGKILLAPHFLVTLKAS